MNKVTKQKLLEFLDSEAARTKEQIDREEESCDRAMEDYPVDNPYRQQKQELFSNLIDRWQMLQAFVEAVSEVRES